ncbi:hypothetical protein Q3G72_007668 [Acer saccharum]|nr:hypothetical protein Q3G72_007668 [Acer saccharum]
MCFPIRTFGLSCCILFSTDKHLQWFLLRLLLSEQGFNTARVGAQNSQMKMTHVPLHGGFSWGKHIMKRHPHMLESSFTMSGLLEQINTTRDVTDYLCYSTAYSNGLILLVSSAITLHSSSYNVCFLCDPAGTAYGSSDLISNANIF